eukprot:UN05673
MSVTHAFIPLVMKHTSRIVNVGSVAGLIHLPIQGIYMASKHAVEGYTDSLRMELAPQGISLSLIEPGVIKSEIANKGLDSIRDY